MHVLDCVVVYFCTHVHRVDVDLPQYLSACECLSVFEHTHRLPVVPSGPLLCCFSRFLFKRDRPCVPSWHAPWDNERLCIGLDC